MGKLERLKELEEELRKTKYNKRTEHAIGLLKAKIARLKHELYEGGKSGRKTDGFSVKKTGDATVVLVGFPSVGKSTLLNKLTNAKSKVGFYEFTTLNCIPGMLNYKNAKIQLVDIPGLIIGASSGIGHGKKVLSIVRNSDLILIIVDANKTQQIELIKNELKNSGIIINKKKPDIRIKKKAYGGISIASTVKLERINEDIIKSILKEFKIMNADVLIREEIDVDDFIDAVYGNRVYIPALFVINKIDVLSKEDLKKLQESYTDENTVFISAELETNLELLKSKIFEKLELMRIFLKKQGKKPDFDEPLILKNNSTVKDLCAKIHKEFVKRFRFARVWGSSKFPGQKVGINYKLKDKDIVQIYLD